FAIARAHLDGDVQITRIDRAGRSDTATLAAGAASAAQATPRPAAGAMLTRDALVPATLQLADGTAGNGEIRLDAHAQPTAAINGQQLAAWLALPGDDAADIDFRVDGASRAASAHPLIANN